MASDTEVAFDESGSEGERLIGGNTDVFAHAGVRLGVDEADAWLAEVRRRAPTPADEFKANHILREKNHAALLWVLGPDGPFHGRARVHLTVAALRTAVARPAGPFEAIMEDLARAAPALDAARRTRTATPPEIPVLDPMPPAVVAAVTYWSARSRSGRVAIVHDRQTGLTPDRVALIRGLAGDRLARLSFAVAGADARIQLADVLAGAARKLASDELNGRADPALTALLLRYVDTTSVWSEPFWSDG
ncbi:MAG: NAD-dependent protein deacetylase of SIR2 family [Streptosporangiales bacterium]|nr:NAD-dependent protein deacetylase of SIR2 family [Streptosporangiales bacterium]